MHVLFLSMYVQGGPQKSKPLPNYQKLCQIVLKSAIRFLHQTKEMIKHHNITRRY